MFSAACSDFQNATPTSPHRTRRDPFPDSRPNSRSIRKRSFALASATLPESRTPAPDDSEALPPRPRPVFPAGPTQIRSSPPPRARSASKLAQARSVERFPSNGPAFAPIGRGRKSRQKCDFIAPPDECATEATCTAEPRPESCITVSIGYVRPARSNTRAAISDKFSAMVRARPES